MSFESPLVRPTEIRPESVFRERGTARWYLNRLRCMSLGEIAHRGVTAVRNGIEGLRVQRGISIPAPQSDASPAPWLAGAAALPRVDPTSYRCAADEILSGRVRLLDDVAYEVGFPPVWCLNPVDRIERNRSDDAPHRRTAADVRFLIELHRHQALVTLAQAWRLTSNPAYRTGFATWLGDWIEHCANPTSPAWSSALEAAMRLMNWSIAWQLLCAVCSTDAIDAPLRERWLGQVYLHARYVRRNYSRHSSANNHLLGELAGVYLASLTWRHWPVLARWGEAARKELIRQGLTQNTHDGVNREQSTGYQSFAFEILMIADRAATAAGQAFPTGLRNRLGAMARFIAAVRDAGGHVPAIGDADGACAIRFAPGEHDRFDRMIAWAVAADITPELAQLARRNNESTLWLFGAEVPAAAAAEPHIHPLARDRLPRSFPAGGYFLLGSRFGQPHEILMTADCGALGYLGIAAHGHADALALCLSVAGVPVLVDRGTYVYNADPTARRHFRSTRAHNTVCIDGMDQSLAGGPFIWLAKARTLTARFSSKDQYGEFVGRHDGYRRLKDPVVHQRRIVWHGYRQRFQIIDQLDCAGDHDVEIAWHFSPACDVQIGATTIRAVVRGALVEMDIRARVAVGSGAIHGRLMLYQGPEDEFLGWHSPRFGERVPAPSVLWRARIGRSAIIATTLRISFGKDSYL